MLAAKWPGLTASSCMMSCRSSSHTSGNCSTVKVRKSAGEWIDSYVIQEAKNLLRYSGKNVQQIAYELNFTNQSSFGKYFKNITGMSPTAFQNAN